jgi:S-adenosylmethionine synthetase
MCPPKGEEKLLTSRMRGFFMRSFTSESVCSGHPDKVCDQISDSIVDAVLAQDKFGRAAVETLVTTNKVVVAGEITAKAKIDFEKVIRSEITRLGYTNKNYGFSDASDVEIYLHAQSPEIAVGVKNEGAGDQGMMFGYACRETETLMPMPIAMAHAITKKLDVLRETKVLGYFRPDGKSQVTIEYEKDKPVGVSSVVVAIPHNPAVDLKQVKEDVFSYVVKPVVESFGLKTRKTDLIVNGTGVWHQGGPAADTGVTGRKIIVDTYGGYARQGGGAFSGKDPTKVDRSGAYAARYLAKNIVAAKLATRAEVRLAYFIGAKKPVMQEAETFGTAKASEKVINAFMKKLLDTSVTGILDGLDLRRPIYRDTAAYGHFGRDGFPWEEVVG